jgi:hypothetical protein
VPENLEFSGDEETFTIKVEFDTRELYGRVVGTRDITVCRE